MSIQNNIPRSDREVQQIIEKTLVEPLFQLRTKVEEEEITIIGIRTQLAPIFVMLKELERLTHEEEAIGSVRRPLTRLLKRIRTEKPTRDEACEDLRTAKNAANELITLLIRRERTKIAGTSESRA